MKTIWLSKFQRKLLTTPPALQLTDGFSLHTYAGRLPYPRHINLLYHLSKLITAEQLDILLAALTLLLAVLTLLLTWRVAHPPNQKISGWPTLCGSFAKRVGHSSPRARASILEFCYSIYRSPLTVC